MFSRLTILLTLFLIADTSVGQNTNILKLKNKNHYSEHNIYNIDTTPSFIQELCYDKPLTVDEEHCYILKIIFLDTLKAREIKRLNINKDTSIIKCLFDIRSVWSWEDENTIISGNINILTWTNKSIKVRLDLNILDNRRKKTYTYIGDRTFSSQTSLLPNETNHNHIPAEGLVVK